MIILLVEILLSLALMSAVSCAIMIVCGGAFYAFAWVWSKVMGGWYE